MNYPYDSRPIDYRFFAFPIDMDANSQQRIYFRILSSHIPLISPLIGEPITVTQVIDKNTNINLLSIGICLGILFFMLVFTPLATTNRDGYLFCLFLFDVTLIMLYTSGYVFTWIPDEPEIHKFLMVFLLTFNNPVNLFMMRAFYDINKEDKLSTVLIFGISAIFMVELAAYPLLGYEGLILPVITTVTISYCALFIIAIRYFMRRTLNSGLYLLANGIFMSTTLYSVLCAADLLPYSEFSRHAFGFSIVIQALIYAVAIARKVYWQLREKDELKTKAAIAEAQNRTKSEFLATMSHEIRTPINGVIGMAQMLQTTEQNKDQQHYTDIIIHSGSTLLRVINDILDYSKIEAGKMELEHVAINLDELITQTCSTFVNEAIKRKLHFSAQIHPECPFYIYGDPVRIQQVLNNLLSNAFKFTTSGSIHLNLSGIATGDNLSLHFQISDSGIGIKKSKQAMLFESFSQADRSTTRNYGGTGLGLSITKQLVEMMGGEIGVNSEPGQGAQFWFSLECKIDMLKHKQWQRGNKDLAGKQVLLIYPYPQIRQAIEEQFSYWGIQVTSINTIEESLNSIKQRRKEQAPDYDAIFCFAPYLAESSSELQQQLCSQGIPIVLNEASQRFGNSLLEQQYDKLSCLHLPHTIGQLRDALLKQLTPQTKDLEYKIPSPISTHTLHTKQVMVAEDNPVNRQVIAAMLGQHGISIEFANDGQQAIDMFQQHHQDLDLIFMDCDMPNVDGYQASRRIRELEKHGSLEPKPIIALTAHVLPEAINHCLSSGMNEVITKPINKQTLEETLLRFLCR
jgi:signal transduction histidine kinase/CheY-like chemotaxis protein